MFGCVSEQPLHFFGGSPNFYVHVKSRGSNSHLSNRSVCMSSVTVWLCLFRSLSVTSPGNSCAVLRELRSFSFPLGGGPILPRACQESLELSLTFFVHVKSRGSNGGLCASSSLHIPLVSAGPIELHHITCFFRSLRSKTTNARLTLRLVEKFVKVASCFLDWISCCLCPSSLVFCQRV